MEGHSAITGICPVFGSCQAQKTAKAPRRKRRTSHYRLVQKNAEADNILLGSPIYSADVPSTLKAVIECASVVSDSNPGMFRHKVCGTVAVAGRGGAMNVIDTLHHFLLNKKISGRLYLLEHHLRPVY